MKEWLTLIVAYAVMIIHAMALVIIIIGTIEAFLRSLCAAFSPSAPMGSTTGINCIQVTPASSRRKR